MSVISMGINNFFNRKIIIILVLFISFSKNLNALENKIIFKLDNTIITSIDIENEKNYLITLNPKLKNLKNKETYCNIKKKNY